METKNLQFPRFCLFGHTPDSSRNRGAQGPFSPQQVEAEFLTIRPKLGLPQRHYHPIGASRREQIVPVRRCTIQTVMVNALNMADRDSMGTIVSPFGVSCGFNVADLWICLRATPVRDYQPVAAVRLGMFSSDRISASP